MTPREREELLTRWDDEIDDGPIPRWSWLLWLGWPVAVVAFVLLAITGGC